MGTREARCQCGFDGAGLSRHRMLKAVRSHDAVQMESVEVLQPRGQCVEMGVV